MRWLTTRNSKVAWQSLSLAALSIVFLCSLVTLLDMLLVNNADDQIFVLMPVTAVMLLVSSFITATALFSRWQAYASWLVLVLATLLLGLLLSKIGALGLFSDVSWLQFSCWLALLLGWVCWRLSDSGKAMLLLINIALLAVSLGFVFAGKAISLTNSPLTTLNTAMLVSLNAIANIAFGLAYPKSMRLRLSSLGFVLSVFIAFAVTLIWFSNTHRMQQQVNLDAEHIAKRLQRQVDELVQEQQGLLTRMVKRAVMLDGNVNAPYFQHEADSYLNDFPYLDYIALLPAPQQLWSAAAKADDQLWYDVYLPQRITALGQQLKIPVATPVFFLEYDAEIDHSFLYAFYLTAQQLQPKVAIASINYQAALDSILGDIELDGEQLTILQTKGAERVLQTADYPQQCLKASEFTIQVYGAVSWQLISCNSLDRIPVGLILSSGLALYAGFLAIFLALLSQQLQHKSQRHQDRLVQTNIKLRQSIAEQQRLQLNQQQIMENSADVICIIDNAGRFIEVSTSAETILGYSLPELLNKPFIDFVHPADQQAAVAEVRALKLGKASFNFRNRYLRKDGSEVHLLWSARYVGKAQTIFAIAHDISELARQENIQLAQQSILKQISVEGDLSGILSQICQLAQLQLPELKATLCLELNGHLALSAAPAFDAEFKTALALTAISPAATTCGIAAYQRSVEICQDLQQMATWQSLPANAVPKEISACWSMPMVAANGKVLGTFALYSPSSRAPRADELELMLLCCRLASIAIEKMKQRKALIENEQRYRSLYEFNPDPVFSLDLAGHFLNINRAGIEKLGRDEQQILGQHFSKLIRPECLAAVENHFSQVLQGKAQRYETVAQVPGGSPVDFLITNLPIVIDGQLVGVFGIAKDVSERNKTARALQQSLTRLSLQSSALQGLNDCATGIHSDWDNPRTLRYVIGELKKIMSACQSSILLTDNRYDATPFWYTEVAAGHQPLAEADACCLFEILKQHHASGMVVDRNSIQQYAAAISHSSLPEFLQDNRIILTPVSDRDGVLIGCLMVTDCECRHFDQDEQLFTLQFAKLIYSALEYRQLLQSMITAERNLQSQLQFNQAVTNSMSDALLVTDVTGRVTVLNPSAERVLLQNSLLDLTPEISTLLPLQPENWQAGEMYDTELELQLGEHSRQYICKVAPLRANTQQMGWLVTLHDISAERRADAITRERDQFFTLSLELFCLVDLNGCFVQVNPAFSKVLEYRPHDLVGKAYMGVFDPEDHALISQAVLALRQGNDIHDLEFRVISRSGKLCWLQLSAALSGDIIFCAARDITARKAAERQLEHTLTELKRSNEELNEFAYVASHDLQEPLRKIRTFGDRLLQKVSQDDMAIQDYVSRMCGAAARMQNLINDLLSYSRLNAGQMAYTQINMSVLTQDVLTLLDDSIVQSGAQIHLELLADLVADERQLRQLLQNLLSNALKFHKPTQKPEITIRTELLPTGVRLMVADQGIGFAQQYADKIFNPFQRLNSRAEFSGTGIGLSIVKKIADKHGATIEVIASEGAGAVFYITFPHFLNEDSSLQSSKAVQGVSYA